MVLCAICKQQITHTNYCHEYIKNHSTVVSCAIFVVAVVVALKFIIQQQCAKMRLSPFTLFPLAAKFI